MIVGSGEQIASQRRMEQILASLSPLSTTIQNRIWITTEQTISDSTYSDQMLDRAFWRCNKWILIDEASVFGLEPGFQLHKSSTFDQHETQMDLFVVAR